MIEAFDAEVLADSDALVEALCDAEVLADSDALVEALRDADVLADSLAAEAFDATYLLIGPALLKHFVMRRLRILMHSLMHLTLTC